MLNRVRFVRAIQGVDPARWAARWGLIPFDVRCRCGHPQRTSIPFAVGDVRGLVAPPCACGALPPYCAVARDGSLSGLSTRPRRR